MAEATLVPPEISREKFRRELEWWKANSLHQERGWILLRSDDEELVIELAFLSRVSISMGSVALPVVVCAVRLSYENYDLWPPSLTFIDAFTREPTRPHLRAFQSTPIGPRDVLVDVHPTTHQPFLCVPGIREYHNHPQHTGDDWLLHRALGEGSISTICDRLWRYMARNVIGLNIQMTTLPGWPLQASLVIVLAQGDMEVAPAVQVGEQILAPPLGLEQADAIPSQQS